MEVNGIVHAPDALLFRKEHLLSLDRGCVSLGAILDVVVKTEILAYCLTLLKYKKLKIHFISTVEGILN
jgi:hypothetical protein